MNTSKLKTFAQKSRQILKEGVKQKLRYWGFNEQGEVEAEPMQVGGGFILRGETIDDPTVLPKWKALQAAIRRHGVDATIEEAAYTWFNRLMAIRILSKNGYDTAQLEYEGAGSQLPVILAKARRGMTSYLSNEEKSRLQLFITDYSQELKAFSILITGYCHSHNLLNRVFGRLDDFTELLLPDNILADNGFIHLLNTTDAIAEEDYSEVELIGWLYQFYISEKKDEVFAGFKKNKKAEAEDIPAATQIFTPNWIVKYMVQNTAGRIWLDHHPDSKLKDEMKYLVDAPIDETSADQVSPLGGTEGGQKETQLLEGGDPIHLKFLDPACGSGHILVEGFSLLYEMYMEEFYMPQEAVENILTKNIFGLELDLRAAQLARFAVLLAAAKKVPEVLKKDLMPCIYAMPEPASFSANEVQYFLGNEGADYEKALSNALQLMQQAKNLGSVMQFKLSIAERNFIISRRKILQTEAQSDVTTQALVDEIEPYLDILFTMTESYEAVVANPPYMGRKSMNKDLGKYLENNYPFSKSDLMTVFMEVSMNLCQTDARMGMINMHNWMFLSSFEALRKIIIEKYHIDNMLHLGPRTFDELSGEVVQNAAFVLQNCISVKSSVYYRLVDAPSCTAKKIMFNNNKNKYANILQSNFEKIPSSPIAYWVSKNSMNAFVNGKRITNYVDTFQGIITGNNEKFLRLWGEVSSGKIPFHASEMKSIDLKNQFWIPYNKGGDSRKWYGTQDYVVNWKFGPDDKTRGKKSFERYYLKEYVAWSYTVSNFIATRYYPAGFLWDVRGSGLMDNTNNLYYLQGLIASKIGIYFFKINNSTLSCQVENIIQLPIIVNDQKKLLVDKLVIQNISISRADWDSTEVSWDFEHPWLIGNVMESLEKAYNQWKKKALEQFYQIHANEEELNRIFINIYSLNEELNPVVPLKDITILQQELDRTALEETEKELREERVWKLVNENWQLYINTVPQPELFEGELPAANVRPALPIKRDVVMKQLISYAMGCMMGRYSLYKPGLILANQGETLDDYQRIIDEHVIASEAKQPVTNKAGLFTPDDDAIIPIMGSNCGFSDDAVFRLRHFIEVVWGSETLTQNINFLQECLNMDLEKFMTNQNQFWKDHTSRYKKKPIYWLFSSPKGAFQVLVYMHRMTKFTVQKIRDNYLLKHLQWIEGQARQLEARGTALDRNEQKRLDWLRKALLECEAYDLELKDIADKCASDEITIDLDDGVAVNYPKFKSVVAKIK